jgi:excisionase family DNA binding protein
VDDFLQPRLSELIFCKAAAARALGVTNAFIARRVKSYGIRGHDLRFSHRLNEALASAGIRDADSSWNVGQSFTASVNVAPNNPILTADEVADLLRISRMTVARYFKSGILPGLKFGKALRFSRNEIEALMAKRQQ